MHGMKWFSMRKKVTMRSSGERCMGWSDSAWRRRSLWEVLVKDAWDEEVPIYELQSERHLQWLWCRYYRKYLQHGKDHALNDGTTGGYTTKQVEVQVGTETVHHEAVYEDKWIVDKEAWTEEVVQGRFVQIAEQPENNV